MARRSMRAIGAGRRLPLVALVIIALLLLLLPPAHAGWGGVDNRHDPRLAVKKPHTGTPQVAPGQQLTVAITVKRARHRQPALFTVTLPDGALFVGPKGRHDRRAKEPRSTPAPTSGSGWKAERAAAKAFPMPDAVLNGTAGERTLQWHLVSFPRRHNPIKLTFEVDFCGPSSQLPLRFHWQQGGRSARPALITINVSPSANAPAAPETFVDWNAPVPPYESLLLIACHRPDPANPGVCLECIDDPAWVLHDGRCVCAVGAGTHLTANSTAAGWSTTPPATDGGCQEREMHPGLAKGSYGPLSCDATNPRAMEAMFIDPPACTCRLCPEGYTSDGGDPAQAACFLTTGFGSLQAFGIMFGFQGEEGTAPAVDGRRRELVPLDLLDAANALASSLASALSHVPERLLGALEPIADFTLDGPVSAIEVPTATSNEPYLFSARYIFHASEASRDAVVEAINGVAQDPAFNCASWVAYTGVNVCALVQAALPPGFQLVNPWARPLPSAPEASRGRLMMLTSSIGGAHRALWFAAINTIATFGTRALSCFGNAKDNYDKSGKKISNMGLEAKALAAESLAQLVGGIFGLTSSAGEDESLTYLKQIDETTKETLDRVKDVQVQIGNVQAQLRTIEQQLKDILKEVQENKCLLVDGFVVEETDKLISLWDEYYGEPPLTLLNRQIRELDNVVSNSPFRDQSLQQDLIAWAKKVDNGVNVYSLLNRIHSKLIRGSSPGFGAIGVCQQYFHNRWKEANPFPLDDRQYYNDINAYLTDKIVYQVHGVQMIQDAYLILAMNAVREHAKARNESFVMGVFTEQSNICNLIITAKNQSLSSALAAGAPFCEQRSFITAKIYNNIVEQIEHMGMPLSNGGAGEGVRLLLGSDITGIAAVLVSDTSNVDKQTTYPSSSVKTRWLLPASLDTFDARCAHQHDVGQADVADCPAVGAFRSCAHGCNLNRTREARWRRDQYVLGYWGGNWTVAGGAVWEELRGLLTGWIDTDNNTAVGDGADIMALLERKFPFPSTHPFTGMTTRPFWIVNKTAAVRPSDIAIDVRPFFKTWDMFGHNDDWKNPRCKRRLCRAPDDYTFPFYPSWLYWREAQCLAAYNPSQGKNVKARQAGATGVHCTNNDFTSLYRQSCHHNRPPRCGGVHTFCSTTIKPELVQRFGAAMQPSNGKKGNLSAACKWDKAWMTDTDEYENFGGSCHLGVPRNGEYALEWACEGFRHPDASGRDSNQTYWRGGDLAACSSPEFSYAWFPELVRWPGLPREAPVPGWPNPTDSATRPMFRLPVFDINKIQCTPSPFVNVPGNDGKRVRPRHNRIIPGLPTLCNDEMTQAVLALVGPGDYEADAGSSYAELKLASDGDTVTCDVTWDHTATPGVYTTNVYITVREGPIYDTDRLDTTGNNSFPLWSSSQTDLYFNATRIGGAPPQPTRTGVSLSAALPRNRTSTATRVVGCTVIGEDPQTRLPITVFAQSKVALDGALPWEDFEYPMVVKPPCNAAGCIASVARFFSSSAGPGLLLAAGPPVNLPSAGDRDALFVRVQGSPNGLLQVVPSLINATHNLTEAVYSEDSLTLPSSSLPAVTGWQMDRQGFLYVAGRVGDSSPTSPWQFIAALDYNSTDGAYATTVQMPVDDSYGELDCPSVRTPFTFTYFKDITSMWLEPASGDLYVVDAFCSHIRRIDQKMLRLPCPAICGYANPFTSFDTGDLNTGFSSGSVRKVSIVGDPARGRLYVAFSEWCRVAAFNLATGVYVGLVAGTPGLTPNTNNCGFSGDGGPAANATRLSADLGQMDVAPNGDLYITDTGNNRVRRVEYATGLITTVAGNGLRSSLGDLGQAVNASLTAPRAVKYMETPDVNVAGGVRRLLYITEGTNLRRVLLN